jgi:ribonuclease HII
VPAALPDSVRTAIKAQVEKELKAMADSLKLTSAQREKIRPIILDHAYQLRQLRAKYATQPRTPETGEAMMKDAMAIREATDAKLAGAMSAEQMVRYKQMRDEMMERAKARMGVADSTGGAKK